MEPVDDSALLRQFAENHSDEAFAELVTRHVNLVYSVALRQVAHPQNAEEITQAVFIILAKKAAGLRHEKALSSWLFQATRFTAINFMRSEIRRQNREQEAQMQTILNESGGEVWPKIAPLLDDAVADLREKERQAIVLRYYEGRSLREVGLALGASEEAAKKRVGRALEKLRESFAKRGVDSTTAAIAETISAHSVQIAPLALAKTIFAVAVVKGATASTSTLTLIKGALKIMAWTKMKSIMVTGACVLLAGGVSTVLFVAAHRTPAEFGYDRAYLANPAVFPRENARIVQWRQKPWPAEKQREEARIKSRQAKDETVNATTIDLKPYLNTALTDSPASEIGNMEDNLAELPSGTSVFAGVPFDVKGSIQLNSSVMFSYFKKTFPNQAGPIRINRPCAKIHLLHGANCILSRDFGRSVAKLVLHYTDGSSNEIFVVAGKHLFDWWAPLFTTGVDPRILQATPGTERAWTGSNPYIKANRPDESLVLYKSTFDNPRPDVTLASLDYVSTMTEAAPFLVGLTVE
jgi:RNA polymerase sigma factor (sigma-70 family)